MCSPAKGREAEQPFRGETAGKGSGNREKRGARRREWGPCGQAMNFLNSLRSPISFASPH